MTVADLVAERGISEVLHFTTNRGLTGSLFQGAVLSRKRLPKEASLKYILHNNSAVRPEASAFFDKSEDWLDYVNLSISEINTRFFGFSTSWDRNADRWWVILSFDPLLLSSDGVYFTTTNNGYEPYCRRATGPEGLAMLFQTPIRRKGSWYAQRGGRPAHLPTCEQAEALFPGELPLEFCRRIYVNSEERGDTVRGWLRDFERDNIAVECSPEKFKGAPN